MSKRSIRGSIVLAALLLALPVFAGGVEIDVDGEVRTGWEYLNNFLDAEDHNDTNGADDDADFFPYRALIGVNTNFGDQVSGRVAVQNFGYFGNGPVSKSPRTPDGSVGNTPSSFSSSSESDISLYEAFININELFGADDWSVRIGRAEHSYGNELHLGVNEYYIGTSYDGIRFSGDLDAFDVDIFYYELEETMNTAFSDNQGTNVNPFGEDSRTLGGLTFGVDLTDGGQKLEPYVLNYRNNAFSTDGWNVYTIGALYGRRIDDNDGVEDNPFDWSIEAAYQTGDMFMPAPTADLDVSAFIVEGSFGFNWMMGGDNRSRVHLGYLQASGDDNGSDTDFDAFMPLFPDMHANNRLGDLDLFGGASAVNPSGGAGLSNITDISLGYRSWCGGGKHDLAVSLHKLAVTDTPSNVEDDLGLELDVVYNFQHSDHLGFEAGVANLFVGDAVDDLVGAATDSADDIMRVWWRFKLDW